MKLRATAPLPSRKFSACLLGAACFAAGAVVGNVRLWSAPDAIALTQIHEQKTKRALDANPSAITNDAQRPWLATPEGQAKLAAFIKISHNPESASHDRRTFLFALTMTLPQRLEIYAAMAGAHRSQGATMLARLILLDLYLQDPRAAAAWAQRDAAQRGSNMQLMEFFEMWAEESPILAFSWLRSLPTETVSADAMSNALLHISKQGRPAEALRLAETLSMPTATAQNLIARLLTNFASFDPVGAAAQFQKYAHALTAENRNAILKQISSDWASTDPKAALHWIESVSEPSNQSHLRLELLNKISFIRPQLALEELRKTTLTSWTDTNHIQRQAFSTWLEEQPGAAFKWLDQLDDSASRARLLLSAGVAHAAEDPAAADELLLRLPEKAPRQETIGKLIESWAAKDVDRTLAWIEAHTSEEITAVAMPALLKGMGPAAADLLVQLTDHTQRAEVAGTVIDQWISTSLDEVATWALGQRDPIILSAAVDRLSPRLAQSSPEQSIQWAQQLPTTEARARAVAYIGNHLGKVAPAVGVKMLNRISDPQAREIGLYNLALQWRHYDPVGVRKFLEQGGVPPNVHVALSRN